MHSFDFGEYTVHHNGDFSGDVIVDHKDQTIAKLPFTVMLAVVGAKVKQDRISKLENTDPLDIIARGMAKGL